MGRKRTHITIQNGVGVVDPGGVVNLYGLWDWVGMPPRMGPESRSCTFSLGRPVSRKAGNKNKKNCYALSVFKNFILLASSDNDWLMLMRQKM